MFEKSLFRSAAASAAVMLLTGTAGAVSIELVPVGNPGNENDPGTGYGSVAEPYMIGKYEVTAEQYTEFLNAVAVTDMYGLYDTNMWSSDSGCKIEQDGSSGSYSYSVDGDRASRPVNYVSWGDAARFANWLHNGQPATGVQNLQTTEDGAYFLNGTNDNTALMAITRESDATWFIPTENEWYKAAYHKNDGVIANYWDFPTQADEPNVPSNILIDPDPGNSANFARDSYTVGPPYWTTEVGEFENSASAYGTFDQGGNLWEWNETAVNDSARGIRGGFYDHDFGGLRASSSRHYRQAHSSGNVGLRMASVPEPGCITLFVCGLAAGLIWWRRRAD